MTDLKKIPNPVDVHVGSRVKIRRNMLGLSQEKLGDYLGVTFQQIQKYEKGINRISASRMQQISEILETPVSFFFDDLPNQSANQNEAGFSDSSSSQYVVDFLSTSDGLRLNRAFVKIKDPKLREKIVDLVISIADSNE